MKLLAVCVLCILPCVAQSDYVLRPSDNIFIRVSQSSKFNGRIFQIRPDGFVTLPLLGRVHAGGLTVKTLENELTNRLRQNAPSPPQVFIRVVSLRSQNPAAPVR
jgi:polysaccharide export outer membrane protein